MIGTIISIIFKTVAIISLLVDIAYLTLAQRKVIRYMQARQGHNVVGVYGILQSLANGLMLFSKQIVIPNHSNLSVYIGTPILSPTLVV